MSNHLSIALASISCFTDNGTLDLHEVNRLVNIALEDDNQIDDEEKRVLNNVFSKVTQSEVTEETWSRIQEVKAKYQI